MPSPDTKPPELKTEVPGPGSRALAERLARVESRNVTCLDPLPIFWERAAGSNVWDVDGNCFVDLTAAFGVATTGHAHPEIVNAVREQAGQIIGYGVTAERRQRRAQRVTLRLKRDLHRQF